MPRGGASDGAIRTDSVKEFLNGRYYCCCQLDGPKLSASEESDIDERALEKIEILEDTVKVTEELEISEFGSKVDDDGTPLDAVEIGVTSINLKDNKVSTSKIYTKAHAPKNTLQ